MFKKKTCGRCERKVSENHDFCPYCGNNLKKKYGKPQKEEDWGMLGENDFINHFSDTNEIRIPRGFNTLFNTLMKSLGSQFNELEEEMRREIKKEERSKMKGTSKDIKKSGISISISTSGDKPPEIKVRSFGDNPEFIQGEQLVQEQEIEEAPQIELSKKDIKKFSTLPKEEPITNIKRLSDKVIYEIKMPGVKSLEKISIIKLESSIEIKAIAKDKAYVKKIPINLPITDYKLLKGKLVLELATED